ncbi:MAG: ECF transporter S component [Clostridia bacterium]|nr:ECF transporter S component [Clostridia bacterium]
MKKKTDVRALTVASVLIALAFISVFVLKFKVTFLSFDFKDAILSVISLMYGPVLGIISVCIVAVLEFLTVSDTGVYGLIMNIISSGTFALAVGFVYKYKRSLSGAIIASLVAVISVTVMMLLANIIVTPFYMHYPRSAVIQLIPTLLLPFNLAKSVMNASVMLIIYKPVTTLLKRIGLIKGGSTGYSLA